jgi:hypothetical protein
VQGAGRQELVWNPVLGLFLNVSGIGSRAAKNVPPPAQATQNEGVSRAEAAE